MYLITQSGIDVSCSTSQLTQYSENIEFEFIKDDNYIGYTFIPFVTYGNDKNNLQCKPLEVYNDNKFKIISEALKESGTILLSIRLSKDNTSENTIYLKLIVRPSGNSGETLPEESLVWEILVKSTADQYMNIYYEENYKEPINALITEANNQQKETENLQNTVKNLNNEAKAQQEKASELQNEVDETNQAIDDALLNNEFVPIPEYDVTTGVSLKWKQKDGTYINVGAVDIGGRTILSGSGIPAKAIGRDYDYYLNTSIDGDYAQYLYQKENTVWKPLWKTSGKDGTDSLPVQGSMFLPEELDVPNGYDVSTEYYIPIEYIGIDGINSLLDVLNKKTSITLDEVVQENLTMSSTRKVITSKKKVQVTNDAGVVLFETSSDNVRYLKKDGTDSIDGKTLIDLMAKLISATSFYDVNPKTMLDELKGYVDLT